VGDRLRHSERLGELAPLAALDALDGADREDFRAHIVSGCAACEQEVRRWRRDVSALGRSVAPVAPSEDRRSRLHDAVAASPEPVRRRPPRLAPWLAVAASLAFVVAATDDLVRRRAAADRTRTIARLSAENARAHRSLAEREMRARFVEDPDVRAILLTGLGPQPNARGKVIFSPKARRAVFVAASLGAIPSDRQYELWFLAGGKPIPAGTFDATEGRATVFESELLPETIAAVDKFAVTIEPRGGVPQPTGPMVLAGG